jgi:hypothetical protein
MDEFGWGNTRLVIGEGSNKKIIMNNDEKFDDSMIPLKKFSGESWSANMNPVCAHDISLSQNTKLKLGRVGHVIQMKQDMTPSLARRAILAPHRQEPNLHAATTRLPSQVITIVIQT